MLCGLAGERCERGPPMAGDQLLRGPVLPGRGDVRGQDFSEYNADERAVSQRVRRLVYGGLAGVIRTF